MNVYKVTATFEVAGRTIDEAYDAFDPTDTSTTEWIEIIDIEFRREGTVN